jgi:hypothetical protein
MFNRFDFENDALMAVGLTDGTRVIGTVVWAFECLGVEIFSALTNTYRIIGYADIETLCDM